MAPRKLRSQQPKAINKLPNAADFTEMENKQLLDSVRAQLNETDPETCNNRIKKLDWKLITIQNKSEAACKKQLDKLLTGIPRSRNLLEVIQISNKTRIEAVSKNNANIMYLEKELKVSKKETTRIIKLENNKASSSQINEPEKSNQSKRKTRQTAEKSLGKGLRVKKEVLIPENSEVSSSQNNKINEPEISNHSKRKTRQTVQKSLAKGLSKKEVLMSENSEVSSSQINEPENSIQDPGSTIRKNFKLERIDYTEQNAEETPATVHKSDINQLKRKTPISGKSTKKLKKENINDMETSNVNRINIPTRPEEIVKLCTIEQEIRDDTDDSDSFRM